MEQDRPWVPEGCDLTGDPGFPNDPWLRISLLVVSASGVWSSGLRTLAWTVNAPRRRSLMVALVIGLRRGLARWPAGHHGLN